MLIAALVAYLLLGARITVRAGAAICDGGGAACASVTALGIELRTDAVLALRDGRLRFFPRYERARKRKTRSGAWKTARLALRLLRTADGARVSVRVRLGLFEAHETAVAAGAARALASALLATLHGARGEVSVAPDFGGPCLTASARCIFSLTAGDIMFAALRASAKKLRGGGSVWRSIPSRA